MKMTKKEYEEYVKKKAPHSRMAKNLAKAFLIGGLICCIGQGLTELFSSFEMGKEEAATATSISLIFLSAVLTGIGVYDDIAKFAGAGTLVPITGFANSVVSPALEFKSEGLITGTSARMFVIAGPVLVYGVTASVIYGLILCLFNL